MPLFKVSGWYIATVYVDRIVKAENEAEAKNKAWSEDYIDEIQQDSDIGDFESDKVEVIK